MISYLRKIQDFINRPALLQTRFLDLLLGLSENRKFEVKGIEVSGKILGVSSNGNLRVLIEGKEQLFEQKQIRFLFD